MVTETNLLAWDSQPVYVTKTRRAVVKRPAGAVPRFDPIRLDKTEIPHPEVTYEVRTAQYIPQDIKPEPKEDLSGVVIRGPGRRPKKELTPDEREERDSLVAMVREGLTYEQISIRIGRTVQRTRDLIYKYKIHKTIGVRKKDPVYKRHLKPEEVMLTLDLWNEGKSLQEIGLIVGVTAEAIRYRLRQFEEDGFKMRPAPPRSKRKGISKYE